MVRNKFKKIKIGIEVECILDYEKFQNLDCGGYHNGIKLKDKDKKEVDGWKVERDGSVSYGDKFSSGFPVEFVSSVFTSKKEFFAGLRRLVAVISHNGRYELKEVMEVNKSCGCHIHLSKGNRTFAKRVHSFMYKRAKKEFFDMVEASKLPEDTKSAVLSQYYRSYAKKSTDEEFKRNRDSGGARGSEWNFQSERNGCGLEWRSFNINRVESWNDFFILMGIAFDVVGSMLNNLSSWKKGNLYRKEIEIGEDRVEERTIVFNKTEDKTIEIKTFRRQTISKIAKLEEKKVVIVGKKDEKIEIGNLLEERLLRILRGEENV